MAVAEKKPAPRKRVLKGTQKKKASSVYRANEKDRERVTKLVGYGITEQRIADAMNIARDTLRKHYATALQIGRVTAVERIADCLFENALAGDVKAQMFYLKTVGGWNETINVVNPDAVRILTNEPMTDAEFNEKFCNGADPIIIPATGGLH